LHIQNDKARDIKVTKYNHIICKRIRKWKIRGLHGSGWKVFSTQLTMVD